MVSCLWKRCFFMIIVLKLNHILCMEKRPVANFSSNFFDMWSTEPSKPSAWTATFPMTLPGGWAEANRCKSDVSPKVLWRGGGWLLPNKKRRWDKARRVGFIFTTFSRCQTLTSSTTFNQNFVQVVYVWQQKHDLRSSISKVDHCRRCLRRSDRPRRWLWKWVWKHGRTVMMSLFWNLKWYKINMFFRLVGW